MYTFASEQQQLNFIMMMKKMFNRIGQTPIPIKVVRISTIALIALLFLLSGNPFVLLASAIPIAKLLD